MCFCLLLALWVEPELFCEGMKKGACGKQYISAAVILQTFISCCVTVSATQNELQPPGRTLAVGTAGLSRGSLAGSQPGDGLRNHRLGRMSAQPL